jgi:hypothetical protein
MSTPQRNKWQIAAGAVRILIIAGSAIGFLSLEGTKHSRLVLWLILLGYFALLAIALHLAAVLEKRGASRTPGPKAPGGSVSGDWLQLLTLEYEKGTERYENIYKAVWLNFSYSVAVGAAILTFGASKLRLDLLQLLALVPLVFWYAATFVPMDFYGDQTRNRLKEIETDFNTLYFPPTQVSPNDSGSVSRDLGFQHFTRFVTEIPLWRVSDVVHVVVTTVILYWVWLLASVVSPANPAPLQLKPDLPPQVLVVPQLTQIADSVGLFQRRVDSLRNEVGRAQITLDSIRKK